MRWLPDGWQRGRQADSERATTPHRSATADARAQGAERTRRLRGNPAPAAGPEQPQGTARLSVDDDAGRAPGSSERSGRAMLAADARDVDVSAASFRNLVVGGGVSGFVTVLCAAALVDSAGSAWLWLWQLISGVAFLWFVSSARGSMSSRGFLIDRTAFYARTRGEVFGIPWSEIGAAGIGARPLVENRRPVHPERRRALELYPADPAFPARHPELERWRVEEPAPISGLPGVRYRFHLPPLSRLPHRLEEAVTASAGRKWVGHYRRHLPQPPV